MITARGVGAEIAAAMRGNDLEAREVIERSLEDQMLQGNRGVQRIADGIRQPAIALEALGKLRRALRVDEQNRAELLSLGPDRMEFWIGKILAQHAGADRRAAQPLFLDRRFQLLHCEVGILQTERRKGRKALRARRAKVEIGRASC